ncbi:MAG: hypothetical protein NVS1B11_31930 [Terriglobales bacterium]
MVFFSIEIGVIADSVVIDHEIKSLKLQDHIALLLAVFDPTTCFEKRRLFDRSLLFDF